MTGATRYAVLMIVASVFPATLHAQIHEPYAKGMTKAGWLPPHTSLHDRGWLNTLVFGDDTIWETDDDCTALKSGMGIFLSNAPMYYAQRPAEDMFAETAPEWLPRMEDATPALAAWLPWRVAPEATPESIAAGFRNAFGEVPEADGENMADRAATLYRKELGDGWPKASVWLLMAHGWASLANIFLAARKHDDSLKMPGVHILKAWSERPAEVIRNRSNTGRYPAILTQARSGFGRRKDVLPPLNGTRTGDTVQYDFLPALGEHDEYSGEFLVSALPVELYHTPGPSAPLDIRIGFEAILDTKPRDRRGRSVVLPDVPWGHLMRRIYPGRRYDRTRLFPGLKRAIARLNQHPRWELPVSNSRGGWQGVRVVTVPVAPLAGHPSEQVRFVVTLPNAGKRGGIVDRPLVREAGAKSGAALALATGLPIVWDDPDNLRRDEGRGFRQLDNPGAYPLLSLRAVVSLMYPQGPPKRKGWPTLLDEARDLLDWLAGLRPVKGRDGLTRLKLIGPQHATWTREPGGRRIMPGRNWPGWEPDQQSLIEPPK